VARNKENKFPLLEKVEITDVGSEGKAIAKVNDLVIFVTGAVPGDVVDVKITLRKKNYREGVAQKFYKYSAVREKPFCEHFGICGGCKWQNLPYEQQLFYKQKEVVAQLQRIGKVEIPQVSPILPSAATTYYRNKLEYTFTTTRWLLDEEKNATEINPNGLGFHIPRMFDRVLNINHCYLQPSPSNEIRLAIKEFVDEAGYEYFNHRKQTGFLRNMMVRTSQTGEVMLLIAFFREDVEKREALLNFLKEKFPQITALLYVINSKGNDTIYDLDVKTFHGRDFIFEEMEGLRFKVGAKSFYQTNSQQAYELYKVARDFAQLTGNEIVYDLYTGTGTIANFVAKNAKKVIGVDYIEEAIIDARENSTFNNVNNTVFFAGDMKDVITSQFIENNGVPDVVILDPPRAGVLDKVLDTLVKASPDRIVYVSCNPATQARDLNLLDAYYKVMKVQPVDMFPHTHHVENVVLLKKR